MATDESAVAALSAPGAPASRAPQSTSERRAVAAWLLACCALVFCMVVVGGVTRLTHSGLSITEWQPIVGTMPPLSDADWQAAFEKYQLTPEYQQVNRGMSLAAFKEIFWWEYFHRVLGRLIGLVFFVPLVWFGLRGRIERALVPKLIGIFVLGGLQGAMGWYMVKSGLVDDPRVSQFRLTAHLGLAFLIYAAMLWLALDLLYPHRSASAPVHGLHRAARALAVLVFVTVLSGGFVAGIRAGKAYNTFPLMNGHVVPPELFMLEPWWRNFFYNMATVQFDHRLVAWLLAILVPWFWLAARRHRLEPRARRATTLLLAALVIQFGLGIATVMLAVPIPLAAAHQAGALLVFTAALLSAHALR